HLLRRRIASGHPERVAVALTRVINFFAVLVSPLTRLLTFFTDLLLAPFGLGKDQAGAVISDDEVNSLIEQGLQAGVFNKAETDMVAGVLELDQMPVTALMTDRKSTRLNSSHVKISYAVFCLKKKNTTR